MRVKREDLLRQLESVQPGLSPKEIIEQSSSFVFKDGYVHTYNDEVACKQKVSVNLHGAVQAKPLLEVLRKLNDDEITIETKDSELVVKAGKRRSTGIRMDNEIVLTIDIDMPKKWKSLPDDFSDAVGIVQHCAGKDASKFALTCVHISEDFIEACDNAQMTRFNTSIPVKKDCLIRRDSIKHLTALDMSEIAESDDWIHFRNPSGLIMSCRRFMEKYEKLDPFLKVKGEKATLPKGLAEAADIAQVFTQEDADHDEVSVVLKKGKITIRGEGVSGWFQETAKSTYKGKNLQFLISPKLLIEITSKHNDCIIAKEALRVDGGKFTYVTSLSQEKEKTDD